MSRAGREPLGASPGEHKRSHLHGGFRDPHCSPVAGLLQVELPAALEEDKGMSWEAREACGGGIFSPSGSSSHRGIKGDG